MFLLDLVSEIREGFANLPPGGRGNLYSLPAQYPGVVYVTHEAWGVAIAAPEALVVSERFSGARLYTAELGGRSELRLECEGRDLSYEFAVVCAQFLEPGSSGIERSRLIEKPRDWWSRWRELLGNAVRQSKPYSVLGELLALELLVRRGEAPEWLGPSTNSHDIESSDASYEIKSTISKYSSVIHVAGQHQLREIKGKKLFIVLQRFEPSSSGECIDAAVERLRVIYPKIDAIERSLKRLGYERGSGDRAATYQLLSSTKYLVDQGFPRITLANFVGETLPKGIGSIEYDVDLSVIEGVPFC